jgi:isoquinoline 1-oxidoreductase beta subunit
MSNRMEVSRRTFLQASLAAGGGLLLGFELGPAARAEAASAASDTGFEPNAWLSIADDGTVTVGQHGGARFLDQRARGRRGGA